MRSICFMPSPSFQCWRSFGVGFASSVSRAILPARDDVTRRLAEPGQRLVLGFHGVRYQVRDVARAVDFYTKQLGFELEHQQLPAFATVSIEGVKLLLSGPGASGSRPMPDSRKQAPGGWNRIVLQVADLPARITTLKNAGLQFRNEME